MKTALLRIIKLSIVLLASVQFLFGQGVEENAEVRNYLNNMFSTLDKTKVPNGLLRDYAFELVDFDTHNGIQLNNENILDRPTYEMLLRSIKSSAVGTAPFGSVSDIMENQGVAGSQNTVSLSGAIFKYSYIKANALDDQLINYVGGKVSDNIKNGVWQNPYASNYVIGIAPHDSIFNVSSLTFKLNSNVWFSNVSYNKIEVDPGDGGGYKQITIGGSITANYSSSGRKEIKLRVSLSEGGYLLSHSNINVNLPSSMKTLSAIPSFYKVPLPISGAAYQGKSTSADVFVSARDGFSIKKPFIVVEGFDPRALSIISDADPYRKLKGMGVTSIETFLAELLYDDSKGGDILDEYDLVYVDFINSEEYIQANANTLRAVIEWVNSQKASVGSSEPNIIMGQSMGGLIARYALKKMEIENVVHETSIYISHDAPHLGANVPLGALYSFYAINSFLENKEYIDGFIPGEIDSYLDLVKLIAHSNAAKQMLVNYVDYGGNLNNTAHNLWQNELATLGFPQGDPAQPFRMLSIVNGSYVSSPIVPEIVTANLHGSSSVINLLDVVIPGVSGLLTGFLVQDFWSGVLSVLPGKTKLQVELQSRLGTAIGNNISFFKVRYVKKFLWVAPVTRTLFSYQQGMPNALLYDSYPSSKFSINQDALIMSGGDYWLAPFVAQYDYDTKVAPYIPFVPASSALAVGSGLLPLTAALFTSKPTLANTPFGNNYYENRSVSKGHISFRNEEAVWLLAQLKYSIEGPLLGTTGSKYSLVNPGSGTITWGSSNTSIATINSSGVLTVTGKGVLDITATVNGTSISTRIAVGTPRFVLADAVHRPGFYEIKAECIDTEPGYADFINSNKSLIVYEWGVKNEDGPIEWFDSESPELKLGTTEDNNNTTIYLKVRDINGVESTPIFVRITGYDIYNLIINSWIVNNKGEIFTSTGTKLNYMSSRMNILKRNATGEYANARWNPTTAIIVNDEGTQRGILWSPYGYMKNVLPIEELERIKTYPNNAVLVYRLMLRNFDKQIFQKTPFTVIYKANFPN